MKRRIGPEEDNEPQDTPVVNDDAWRRSVGAYVNSVNKAYLRLRGWSRGMIERYLGEPDRRLVRRGRPSDRPECRYAASRVRAAEDLPEVIELLAGRARLYGGRVVRRRLGKRREKRNPLPKIGSQERTAGVLGRTAKNKKT